MPWFINDAYEHLKIKNADYCWIITGISKSKAINLMQNIDLTEKSKTFMKLSSTFQIYQKLMPKTTFVKILI